MYPFNIWRRIEVPACTEQKKALSEDLQEQVKQVAFNRGSMESKAIPEGEGVALFGKQKIFRKKPYPQCSKLSEAKRGDTQLHKTGSSSVIAKTNDDTFGQLSGSSNLNTKKLYIFILQSERLIQTTSANKHNSKRCVPYSDKATVVK